MADRRVVAPREKLDEEKVLARLGPAEKDALYRGHSSHLLEVWFV